MTQPSEKPQIVWCDTAATVADYSALNRPSKQVRDRGRLGFLGENPMARIGLF